jgi:hypothetical protein
MNRYELHDKMLKNYLLYIINFRIFVLLFGRITNSKKTAMKKNMGAADRLIRAIIAAVVVILYFTDVITGTLGIILMIVAGVFLLTSLVSVCPLYLPFGIRTRKSK